MCCIKSGAAACAQVKSDMHMLGFNSNIVGTGNIVPNGLSKPVKASLFHIEYGSIRSIIHAWNGTIVRPHRNGNKAFPPQPNCITRSETPIKRGQGKGEEACASGSPMVGMVVTISPSLSL